MKLVWSPNPRDGHAPDRTLALTVEESPMMGNKKLSELRLELRELLAKLPGGPKVWLEREIRTAERQSGRDVEILQMLRAALHRSTRNRRRRTRTIAHRRAAKA